jgi:hypothetical protein
MKKILLLLAIVTFLASCKEEIVKKPNRLIEKPVMIDIMYDLSLLDAIKYQNSASLDTFKINPKSYIYKKYKIDSLQFVKSNSYYASNYKEYSEIIDQVNNRLAKNKKDLDAQIKAKKDKEKLARKPLLSPKTELKQALK